MELLKRLEAARRRSVPIVGIATADPLALVQLLRSAKNGKGRGLFTSSALLQWDSNRGWSGLNDDGVSEVAALCARAGVEEPSTITANVVDSLREAINLPEGAALVCHNFHLCIDRDGVSQGIQNLRDEYKANGRMLILLGPELRLPSELTNDVRLLNEALPGREEIETKITDMLTSNDIPVDSEQVKRASDALVGLSMFAAEQSAAMALSQSGLDISQCWEMKKGVIEQTRGLTVEMGGPTFKDLGGLRSVITFAELIAGKIKCVARVDELEKMLAGAGGAGGLGDTSGVSQDALGVILREMEGNGWKGLIAVGPPGSGKTIFSQAFGASIGVPTIAVDLGGAKGGIVGQSEERIRSLCKTVQAIGGSGVYWIATCNNLQVLPSALLRRFTHGIWFFDLPSAEERDIIWKIQTKAFGVPDEKRPVDVDWTGAEIRNCASLAADTGLSLVEAAEFLVPVAVSDMESIKRLRGLASGRFKSASYKGAYRLPVAGAATRKLSIEGGE